jgi:hypothetical protein
MSNRYEYLVEYAFDGGSGRSFSVRAEALNSADAVRRLDESIQADLPHLQRLNVRSFQLLRKWSE